MEVSREFKHDRSLTRFAVIDTGRGIKPGDQARLFAAFEQIESSPSHHSEGTGLGLYISQMLAASIAASITFQSEFGNGSTFSLELPE